MNAYLRWLISEEPSRAWQQASFAMWQGSRKPLLWMAKHLKIDANDERTWFALAGFAPMQVEGRWNIAAPTQAPDPLDPDSLPGDEVVAVDPETGSARIIGDTGPAIVAPSPQPNELYVHTDGMKWLRAWADDRVVFWQARKDAIEAKRIVPTFSGEPPAALAIGDPKRVPWPQLYAKTIRADFENAKIIKSAIFRAADLPRVEAA